MTKYKLVATAAAGIEALVGKELRNMGYEVQVEKTVKPSLKVMITILLAQTFGFVQQTVSKSLWDNSLQKHSTRFLNKQRRSLGRKFFQSMRNSRYQVNL